MFRLVPRLVAQSGASLSPPRFITRFTHPCRALTHEAFPTSRKRVIGAIAHIDSGKTTTSEAMLYTAGALTRMGNVDFGDTTMDYLPAERERGITIAAAAICFEWRNHQLFLVDSPGHLDFFFEVERALRVMDGVVVLLDAVSGVQPQTETVWRQADRNKLPRLVFVNKMDREGADFKASVAAVRDVFRTTPAVLHVPLFDESSRVFSAVYNLLERFPASDNQNKVKENTIRYEQLTSTQRKDIDAGADSLAEAVAEVDDEVMALWLNGCPIPRDRLVAALREGCISRRIVPVLSGASLREIGVSELLDCILQLLPSPAERGSTLRAADDSLVELGRGNGNAPPFLAYAFKVSHDRHRGRLVHLRAFAGKLSSRSPFLNTTKKKKEIPTRLLRILADQHEDIDTVETGDIFAAVCLLNTFVTSACILTLEPTLTM